MELFKSGKMKLPGLGSLAVSAVMSMAACGTTGGTGQGGAVPITYKVDKARIRNPELAQLFESGKFDASRVDRRLYAHQRIGKTYKIMGKSYTPRHEPYYDKVGVASWYGGKFHGKKTASGEIYNMNNITAAHKTLPLHSMVYVTNLENGKSILVRINDRGPFVDGRIIDLSRATAHKLNIFTAGIGKVRVQYAGPAHPDLVHNSFRPATLKITPRFRTVPKPELIAEALDPAPLREPANLPAQSVAGQQEKSVRRHLPFQNAAQSAPLPGDASGIETAKLALPSLSPAVKGPAGESSVTLTIKGPVQMAFDNGRGREPEFIPAVNNRQIESKNQARFVLTTG